MKSLIRYIQVVAVIWVLVVSDVSFAQDCDIHATITRRIENDGFHRELLSLVEIVVDHADMWANCSVILEEKIPKSFYVNPDQLLELQRFGQLSSCATVLEPVNIELPEAVATEHTVIIHSILDRSQNLLSTRLSLPLHVRYRAPIPGGGLVEGHLGSPRLLLQCPEESCLQLITNTTVTYPCEPCVTNSTYKCVWHSLPYETNAVMLSIRTPVGNSNLRSTVVTITFIVTWAAAVYVLCTLLLTHRKEDILKGPLTAPYLSQNIVSLRTTFQTSELCVN